MTVTISKKARNEKGDIVLIKRGQMFVSAISFCSPTKDGLTPHAFEGKSRNPKQIVHAMNDKSNE
jgi:hypothetical protein